MHREICLWVLIFFLPLLQLSLATPTLGLRYHNTPAQIKTDKSDLIIRDPKGRHHPDLPENSNVVERSVPTCPMISCEYIRRFPKAVIVPSIMAAESLTSFWTKIAIDAMEADIHKFWTSRHFTISAGMLKLTMACVGQAIPWDFVQDFASQQIQAVNMGLLDTFEVWYKQHGTGIMVYVSLTIVGDMIDSPGRKRPRPNNKR